MIKTDPHYNTENSPTPAPRGATVNRSSSLKPQLKRSVQEVHGHREGASGTVSSSILSNLQ